MNRGEPLVKPIKIGLVGVGVIAQSQHIPALRGNPAFRLEACTSRNGRVEGIDNFPSLESMLDARSDLDAITVCTPPQAHYDAARLGLMRGKHVFLEKPPCATVAQLDHLALLARQSNCSLFQSWHSRHAAAVNAARMRLEGRTVRAIQIVWKEDVRQWHPGQEWIWQSGGFGVFDPGINALSILTKILQDAVFVMEARLYVPENCEAPIAADLLLSTDVGTPISARFDFRHTGLQTWDIDIETDNGALKLAEGGSRLFTDGKSVAIEDGEGEYASLYRHFAGLVATGVSDVDARPFQLVADAFLLGTRVTVDRFDP
jgi:D-galactose 1-dehydrogenase